MVLGADFGGGDFAAAFGGLFLEEAVDGVHLVGASAGIERHRERGSMCELGISWGFWE